MQGDNGVRSASRRTGPHKALRVKAFNSGLLFSRPESNRFPVLGHALAHAASGNLPRPAWRLSSMQVRALLACPRDQHFTWTCKSVRAFELPELSLDFSPGVYPLGLAQRRHHLVQRTERFALEAHALAR